MEPAAAPPELLVEQNLVRRSLAGDEDAFRDLVIRYQGAVFACAKAITRNDADAADAAQEAFIRLYRNLAQFDPRRSLRPYLLKIAANCARTMVTRRVRAAREVGGDAREESTASAGPGSVMVRRERHAAVRMRVESLPRTLREVCTLFYLADCSCAEVAAVLSMSASAVKVALHRARRRLHQELTEERYR